MNDELRIKLETLLLQYKVMRKAPVVVEASSMAYGARLILDLVIRDLNEALTQGAEQAHILSAIL